MSQRTQQRIGRSRVRQLVLACCAAMLLVLVQQGLGLTQAVPVTTEDVEAIARSTTVLIGPDLERESFEAGEIADTSGSGVIIAKQALRYPVPNSASLGSGTSLTYQYYVLTNAHVVADRGVMYGIRTSDGEFARVDDSEEAAAHNTLAILRLGRSIPNSFEGTDLAIMRFLSDRDYPVAAIASPQSIQEEETVLVSGWPVPEVNSFGKRSRIPVYGQVVGLDPDGARSGGYMLRLTAFAESNMSGSPVYNERGQVIGIYGRRGNEIDGQGLAVPIGKLLSTETQAAYQAQYPDEPFPFHPSMASDRRAILLGKTNILMADNLTAEEFAEGFGAFDVLRTDPNYQAIQNMKERYNCMQSFADGTFRPSKFGTRAEVVVDLNTCLDQMVEVLYEQTYQRLVPVNDFQALRQTIQELNREVADLLR